MAYNELERRGTADFPVEFFHIGPDHARYHMSAHWHSEIELIRVLRGEFHVRLNQREFVAHAGDVFFLLPETVHQGTPLDCVYECVVAHPDFLQAQPHTCREFLDHLANGEYRMEEYFPCAPTEFHRSVNALFDALSTPSAGRQFLALSAFYRIFGLMANAGLCTLASGKSAVSGDKNILKLKRSLLFIRAHYNEPITLSDMARAVEMSPKYFGAFFKHMTGITPIDYLNQYRVEKASRKLMYTDLSVTEIAYACGFNDLSYFIKSFRKANGISPGKYRKR